MPVIVHSSPGRVTGVWGSALLLRNGKLVPVQVGDEINPGDMLLTSQDGIIELTGATVKRLALPAETVPELIAAIEAQQPQVVPAAGLGVDDGSTTPGAERIARVVETVAVATARSAPATESGAASSDERRLAPELQQPARAGSDAVTAVEEGPAVSLRATAPATTATSLSVAEVPQIGSVLKADGSVLAVGMALDHADLAGLVYQPPNEYDGRSVVGHFAYTVDDALTRVTRSIRIVVTPVNDAPTAASAQGSGAEDTPVPLELRGADVDGSVARFALDAASNGRLWLAGAATPLAAGQTISLAQAALLQFRPDADFHGDVVVTFRAVDDGGRASAPATYALSVTPVNDAPLARADALAGVEDTAAVFSAAALLGNDTDVEGNALRIASVQGGTGGSATLNADGSVSFVPARDFNGNASFSYQVSDGTASSNATPVTVRLTAVNDAPVAVPDALVATEDTPVRFSAAALLGNDTDVDGPALRIASVTSGSGGTAVLNADGTVSFTPAPNFNGVADFAYVASDGSALSALTGVTVNVAAVNDAPVGAGDVLAAVEDTPVTYAAALLLGNDADVEGSALRIASVTNGTGGTVVLNADGSVSFTPLANFNGAGGFAYVLSDGEALSAPVSVVVNVQPVNDAPVAAPDTVAAVEDTPLTLSAAQLLGNDTDVDGPALRIANVGAASGGSVVLNADGSVSFTPAPNFNGAASFSYTASDGELSSTAAVTLNVAAVNDPPQALPDALAATEDTSVVYTAAQLLGNDVDVEASPLRIAAISAAVGGSAVLEADGSVRFTPLRDFNGNASFSYVASDGTALSNAAAVTIAVAPVNDAPVGAADVLTAVEDTPITFAARLLLGNDTDVEVDPLRIASVSSAIGGTVALNADGSVSFTPAPNFNGAASFSYVVGDGAALSAPINVVVNVQAVNDAPVAAPDTLVAREDTPVRFSAAALLGNDADVDGPALRIASVTSGSGGTAVLNADGTVSFTPSPNFNGVANFAYVASDGSAISALTGVTLNVAAVNDAPTGAADVLAAVEDTPVTYAAALLLGNDADVEGSALRIASVTSGTGGTVVLNADGSVSFTPSANFNGAASFSYVLSDGDAQSVPVSVVVNVQPVNDAPVALPDVLAASEDTAVRFDAAALLGNDSDVDGPALRITSVTSGSGGSAALNADGSVSFTPARDFNGTASFAYVASDGELTSTATATVNVAAVNDAPVARPDALVATEDTAIVYSAAELLGNDSDVEASPLRIAAIGAASGGSAVLQADGSVRFTPAQNFNGTAGFSYTASDGVATSNTAAVTITVAAVNDAPTGGADALAMPEDQPTTFAAALLLGNDADVEGSALRIVSVTNGSGGTVVLNADGSVTFSPIGNFNGAANFSYVASDGGALSAPVNVVVNVQPVNDAPVAAPDVLEATEDTTARFSAAQLLGNDSDVDGPALRITSVTSGNGGSAVLNVDGSVSFTPAGNFNGTAGFSYTASDGEFTSPASVTLNVAAVNDAPQANPDSAATPRNRPLLLSAATLLANDTDVDDAVSLRLTSVQAPNNGTVNLDASGNAVFVPTTGYIGPASFSYTVSDAAGATSTTTVAVTVDLPISGPLLEAPATVLSVVEGTAQASGAARILQADLEATLALAPGFLDGFDPPPGPTSTHLGLINTVSGGHVNQTLQLRAGETIALDWSFFNGEDLLSEIELGYNDLLLLIVTDPAGNRQITQLTSTEQLGVNLNGLAADATGTFQFAAAAAGEHHFTWVVTNGRDTTKDSRVDVAPVRYLVGGNPFGTPVPLDIAAQSIDPAAAPSLAVSIDGVPAGAAFNIGTNAGAGRWTFTPAQLDGLVFLPPAGFAGSVPLTITATTVDPGSGLVETVNQLTTITIDATGNNVMGTQVANLLLGTPAGDYMQGFDGGDLLQGGPGNDIQYGDAGNDTLEGDAGADTLYGGQGNDILRGGDGSDQLSGGTGDDSLSGGAGADVFAWKFADRGSVGTPARDIIVDFDAATPQLGGDVLDLRDLLVGELAAGTAPGNLEQFLDFDTVSSPGSTLIRISSGGAFGGGVYSAAAEDQRIVLQGLSLRAPGVFGLDAAASDNDIIQQLLQRGKLIADGP